MTKALLALAAMGVGTAAHAAVVVSYDTANSQGSGSFPQPTVTNADLDGSDPIDAILRNNFSTTVPLNNGVGTYTGPDMFGGLVGTSRNASGAGSVDTTWDGRSLSAFSWRHQTSSPVDATIHALLFFKVDLTANPGGMQLDATSWMGFSSLADGSVDGLARVENAGTQRWAVWDVNGNFYLSNTTIADSANGRVLDGAEFATVGWQQYTPDLDLNFDQASATYTTTTAQLNAIGLAGFGFHVDKDTPTAARHWVEFSKFYVDAAAIPEPASLGLLGLGAVGLLRRRSR